MLTIYCLVSPPTLWFLPPRLTDCRVCQGGLLMSRVLICWKEILEGLVNQIEYMYVRPPRVWYYSRESTVKKLHQKGWSATSITQPEQPGESPEKRADDPKKTHWMSVSISELYYYPTLTGTSSGVPFDPAIMVVWRITHTISRSLRALREVGGREPRD